MRWLTGSDGLAVTEEAAQAKEQRWKSEASIVEGKEKTGDVANYILPYSKGI